ncbi:hypothetical protein [Roseinatronobacter bogoriensis]|uniref:hypothetical protein n=1 Tax=Roseinatronobacter bogoriensis TaxID=119542 RepID=UPI0010660DE9|nr:hypothetical protein [Rhodobaca bogoriensis]MBB4207254.1 hypothetical protein [Rhodobaca bogoriensis DSM 18756]
MPGTFTTAQFRRWQDTLATTSPSAATKAEISDAPLATGLAVQGMSDGIVLRLTDADGATHTFNLNAAMALRLVDCIPAAGRMKGWLDAQGIVIALPDHKP